MLINEQSVNVYTFILTYNLICLTDVLMITFFTSKIDTLFIYRQRVKEPVSVFYKKAQTQTMAHAHSTQVNCVSQRSQPILPLVLFSCYNDPK